MDFKELLDEFTAAVEAGDGARFAACFTEDGEYDDVFYGVFKGRERIADMLENYFWRDGENFKWDMVNPVSDGSHGYAHWFFSYDGKAPHIRGKRIFMEGVGLFTLKDGLLSGYADLPKTGELFSQLNLPAEKKDHILARMFNQQMAMPGFQPHKDRD